MQILIQEHKMKYVSQETDKQQQTHNFDFWF